MVEPWGSSSSPASRYALPGGWTLFWATFDVILLDEPDNTLDIEGKRWLEDTVAASGRTILMVSHDRTVLTAARRGS